MRGLKALKPQLKLITNNAPLRVNSIAPRFRVKAEIAATLDPTVQSLAAWESWAENSFMLMHWDWGGYIIITRVEEYTTVRDLAIILLAGEGFIKRMKETVNFYKQLAEDLRCQRITLYSHNKTLSKLYERYGGESLCTLYSYSVNAQRLTI